MAAPCSEIAVRGTTYIIIIIIIIIIIDDAVCDLVNSVPPSIANISRDVRKHAGSDVILQCDAAGIPKPQVTWYKVSGDVEKSNSSTTTITTINKNNNNNNNI